MKQKKSDSIPIDRYEVRLENGQPVTYAVAGSDSYRMSSAYQEMYDDKHLAIRLRRLSMPEVLGAEAEEYIPLRTSP